jgi:DNA (cytosine-5)-methyltransferase 1
LNRDAKETLIPKFSVIDVFAGVGGLTLGFLDNAVEPRCEFVPQLLVDVDRAARDVFISNFPHIAYFVRDVHDLSGSELRSLAGLAPNDPVHVLVGGPPCQGFSFLGRRALDDPRNIHLLDFLRLVRELRPMVALMENVPLIVTSHGGSVIGEVGAGLEALGYSYCTDILLASDYGVPQFRKRAFVLAYRSDLGVLPSFPKPTHERVPVALLSMADTRVRFAPGQNPYVSVEEAIGDLPSLGAAGGDEVMFYPEEPRNEYQRWAREGSVAIFNHRSRAHSKQFLAKISVIGEGGRNQDLPDETRFSDNYYSQAYARLHRNGIAQTVTTYFGNPGSGRFTHYSDLRSITVREAARLQSFRDSFAFHGHHAVQMRHVGNAVPPLLARALRDQIAADLLTIAATGTRRRARQKEHPQQISEARSRTMRAVQGRNTATERKLRTALWAAGLRGYRLHGQNVPGTPDIVFSVERLAVFVDGCFWHGCPKCYRAPKSRQEYWSMKVRRNRDRDARVNAACKAAGWRVLRIWEHELTKSPQRSVDRVRAKLTNRVRAKRRHHIDRRAAGVKVPSPKKRTTTSCEVSRGCPQRRPG